MAKEQEKAPPPAPEKAPPPWQHIRGGFTDYYVWTDKTGNRHVIHVSGW